ncbi:Developmental regulator flbA [Ceratocystis fimbriata CBS 114723]|uniref:Developmental regulator flbA n=1 Tax=Ceratocystis fimbriata CBS 114723 TaxID=1035309 RepID=A0A2C5X4H0_9PEZI|nr:Developmental regulator flbA [Ceratocystis fimbriata CBS 114723]
MDSSLAIATQHPSPPTPASIAAVASHSSSSSPSPIAKPASALTTTATSAASAFSALFSSSNSPIQAPPPAALSNAKLVSRRQSLNLSLSSSRNRSISYTASQTKNLLAFAFNAFGTLTDSSAASHSNSPRSITAQSNSSFTNLLALPAQADQSLSPQSSRSSLRRGSAATVGSVSGFAASVPNADTIALETPLSGSSHHKRHQQSVHLGGPVTFAFASQPYDDTDPSLPPPVKVGPNANEMHQTSSRLLRMTDDDRPFTRDFKDLFSTLIVSLLPLGSHRVRLTRIEYTFLSEDAINNLSSLKFSQSNRMPDPKDPSRIVTTTTTTTFSMAKNMARSICQRFVEARFIESADGRYQQVYSMKGQVWQMTPKGLAVLDRFCQRNGITQKQITELINRGLLQLVVLERDLHTDKLVTGKGIIEVIFRRLIGTRGPNIKSTVSSADSDSLHDYRDGLTGVKMAAERRVNGRTYKDTFTGKAVCDWLMDCATIVERKEVVELAAMFVEHNLIEAVIADRTHISQHPQNANFQPTKHAVYQLTQRGKDLINGVIPRGRSSEGGGTAAAGDASSANGRTVGAGRDSNTQRLEKILNDAALRLLFRENLRETHCEENLSFYMDVDEFVEACRMAIHAAQKNLTTEAMEMIKEIMAQAYGIYNAFLAPGSPCELNIDHQLRNNLAMRMTKAVGKDITMVETLQDVMGLFEDAQSAVFKLMASDSVPKFLKASKYEHTLLEYDFDVGLNRMPERSLSRSTRN